MIASINNFRRRECLTILFTVALQSSIYLCYLLSNTNHHKPRSDSLFEMSFPFMDANISTLILLLVTVAILPLSVYLWRGKERKLPPYPAEGVVATVLQFTNGTIPQFLFDNTLKLGSVFMLNLPVSHTQMCINRLTNFPFAFMN